MAGLLLGGLSLGGNAWAGEFDEYTVVLRGILRVETTVPYLFGLLT